MRCMAVGITTVIAGPKNYITAFSASIMNIENQKTFLDNLLLLQRQLQENAARLKVIECDDLDYRALIETINNLNGLAAILIAEVSLLSREV